jgi:adenylate cyclase
VGDVAAARVLERFSEIVRIAAAASAGRVIKQIGDAFMLAFPEPRSAVACALEIKSHAGGEAQFPAVRGGVHWGTALYREGDYVGSNVNIASRLADVAGRHEVLVSGAVRAECAGMPGVEFVSAGHRTLKGVAEKIEVFEARKPLPEPTARLTDPVCGMELRPAEVAARLNLEREERSFCSESCLRKFVAAPERYS